MSAGRLDLEIEKGSDFARTLTLTDSAGVAVDLTGYTAIARIKASAQDASPLLSFTVSFNATRTTGIFTISLTDTQTNILTATGADFTQYTKYVYDVFLTTAGGSSTKILEGFVQAKPSVSQ